MLRTKKTNLSTIQNTTKHLGNALQHNSLFKLNYDDDDDYDDGDDDDDDDDEGDDTDSRPRLRHIEKKPCFKKINCIV